MKSVLIVEDEEKIREMIVDLLSSTKIFTNVVTANDGAEGLRKAQNQNFDLIFTDNALPKIKGVEMIGLIQKNYNLNKHRTKFVIFSAQLTQDEIKRAISFGVKNFIVKPSSFELIEEKIVNLFKE